MNKWFIIINPKSGKHFAEKQKNKLLLSLKQLKLPYEIAYTKYATHEIELVNKAINNGFYKFISVGGDGTLHHIVNGVMMQKKISIDKIEIAVIPLGTGNDWIKQYNIPNNIDKAIQVINANNTVKQDIGKIEINNKTVYFNNSSGIGYDGFVVSKINKKFGISSYFIASLLSIFKYKKSILKFSFNKQEITTKTLMATIGLCRYSGGGMQLTHLPNPNDGLFDVTIIKDISFFSMFLNVKKMYNGKLDVHKKVTSFKTSEIEINIIEGEKPFVQADGELLGQGYFKVLILKSALRFVALSY